jgi:antitoxin ParD1/3/4
MIMTVTLTPELEAFVSSKLAAGQYEDANAVICEALRMLREQEEQDQNNLEELRREIAVGIEDLEQGRSAPMDALAILAEVREELAAELRKSE